MVEGKRPEEIYKNIAYTFPFEKFGDKNVEAVIIGMGENLPKKYGWSLRQLRNLDDFTKTGRSYIEKFFLQFSENLGILKFYAPIADPQNGLVVSKHDHPYKIIFSNGATLERGQNAEGCMLNEGEAFVVTPADCLTIVAKSKKTGKVFALHAGRESIFDVNDVNRPTIIENLLKTMCEDGTKPEDVVLWTGFGVSAGKHFDHPEGLLETDDEKSKKENLMRIKNRERRLFLEENFGPECYTSDRYLDLQNVVSLMCEKFGIQKENVVVDKAMCTLSKQDGNGEFIFYSNRRDKGTEAQAGRNLVIVVFKKEK